MSSLLKSKFTKSLLDELSHPALLKQMGNLVRPQKNEIALDLGTGPGNAALELANDCDNVIAIDSDERSIKICNENIQKEGFARKISVKLIDRNTVTDLTSIFEIESFDIVTCRAAFHHFPKPDKVMQSIFDVLKPSGRLYLMDPIFSEFAKSVWSPLARLRESDLESFYTYQEYISFIWNAGLTINTIIPFLFKRKLKDWIKDAPENIQTRLSQVVLEIDENVRNEMHFTYDDKNEIIYYYNGFHMLCEKK